MVGQTVGHYHINSQLGAGGMGEVYRALDTKLGREVAVKVLPRSFAAQQERLGRFEQEARTLATLNHANILVIHDSGVHDGSPYLVSEILEGQTLRDALKSGPLPARRAAEYAVQIAHGLAAAHAKGVIHRDLKPENLFITFDGRVKILDFGLAKLQESADGPKPALPPSAQATVTRQQTEPGIILGTPGYMSPEQVRGLAAEERSDIFSFGAVLYEMLCGQRAFQGQASVEILNAILNTEPQDLSERMPNVPAALERVVRRCLEKRPEQRFQSAADLAFALENSLSSGGSILRGQAVEAKGPFSVGRLLPWLAAVMGISVGVYGFFRPSTASQRPVAQAAPAQALPAPILRKIAINVPAPSKLTLAPVVESMSISPDGKKLVYGNADGLWLRRLDQVGPPVLLATPRLSQNVGKPPQGMFWSPNCDEVAYFDGTDLCRVPAGGGAPRLICAAYIPTGNGVLGGIWSEDNRIFFTSLGLDANPPGLYEVSADGAEPVMALAPSGDEQDFHELSVLPGGHGILMVVYRKDTAADTIAVWTGAGSPKVLFQMPNSYLGQICYAPSGHVIFERRDDTGGIWAFPFSLVKMERTGDVFRVAEQGSLPSIAADGTLAYSPADAEHTVLRQMVWVDRSGKIVETVGSPMASLRGVELSPDERRITAISTGVDGSDALWVFDTARGNSMPLSQTIKVQTIQNAFWFPDGNNLLFGGVGPEPNAVFTQPVDGFGAGGRVVAGWLREFSRSGKYLFARVRSSVPGPAAPNLNGKGANVWAWAELAGKDPKLQGFPEGLNPQDVAMSPDDSLLAYSSNETGQNEVFVVSFPGFTNKVRVSSNGGARMQWRPNGSELYYLTPDREQLWSASVKRDRDLQIGAAAKVCDLPASTYSTAAAPSTTLFQVTTDANRFLMLQAPPAPSDSSSQQKPGVLLVENWLEEFRENH
jgi:eukaryotic-like serine/threonine-protein kinase